MSRINRAIKNRWRSLRIKSLKWLSQRVKSAGFYLQGHMDIDPRSPWFDSDFNAATGGFFPKGEEARRTIRDLPYHDHVRQDMLVLLCRSIEERKVPGAIAELGVYRGLTARLFHHYMPQRKLFLLDTFEGFPQQDLNTEVKTTGLQSATSHFADTSVEGVLKTIEPQNENIVIVKGFFPDSATETLEQSTFALVHLDADLYAPTLAGLEFFYPRLAKGGVVVVHDYNAWPGARQAVDEFCADEQLIPLPMPDKSGSCVVVKY